MKTRETLTFEIYPLDAKRGTPAIREVRICIEGVLTDLTYKRTVKPRLEKVVKILERQHPGKSYWYCRK